MKIASGIRLGRFLHFKPVLRKWIELHEKYCERSGWNDVAWGYIERASVSVFAGACWCSGCIALEEYSELKSSQGAGGAGDQKMGRCDLYFAFKDKAHRKRAYIAEAKMVRPSLATSDWRDEVVKGLKDARRDIRKTHAPNSENKLAMLFVAPTIRWSRQKDAEKLIGEFVKYLSSYEDCCLAWVFPEVPKIRRFRWGNEKERTYPGTAVLIKELRRPRHG